LLASPSITTSDRCIAGCSRSHSEARTAPALPNHSEATHQRPKWTAASKPTCQRAARPVAAGKPANSTAKASVNAGYSKRSALRSTKLWASRWSKAPAAAPGKSRAPARQRRTATPSTPGASASTGATPANQ
jgi:hypothetical protein